MVTMTDVAKYAKVSKMTVSRVLSGNGYVKKETRLIVEQAVQELHYRPNLLAKSLVTGRTNFIAYVLPDICDPFFANACKGVTEACAVMGYTAIVVNPRDSESVESVINQMIDRKADGIIFHHLCVTAEQVDILQQNGVKVVLLDNEQTLDGVVNIANGDYHGAYMAAEFLVDKGYRRIVCVHGRLADGSPKPPDLGYAESFQHAIWDNRTLGFEAALTEHGLTPFAHFYGRGSGAMDKGYACGQEIVRELLCGPELPDAIYCQSDVIALGILSELLEKKVSVPRDVALCGHDGLDTCRYLYPRITTVVLPQYEMGELAAKTLIAEINGQQNRRSIQIPSSLFLGDTTP